MAAGQKGPFDDRHQSRRRRAHRADPARGGRAHLAFLDLHVRIADQHRDADDDELLPALHPHRASWNHGPERCRHGYRPAYRDHGNRQPVSDLALRDAGRPDRPAAGHHAGHRVAGIELRPVPLGDGSLPSHVLPDHFRRGRRGHRGHDRHDPERLSGRDLAGARDRLQLGLQRARHRFRDPPGVGLAQVAAGQRHGPRRRRALRIRGRGAGVLRVPGDLPHRPQGRSAGGGPRTAALDRTRQIGFPAGPESADTPGLCMRGDIAGRHGGVGPVCLAVGNDGRQGCGRGGGGGAIPGFSAVRGHTGFCGGVLVRVRIHPRQGEPRGRAGAGAGAMRGGVRGHVFRGIAAGRQDSAAVRRPGLRHGRRHDEQHGADRSGGAAP